MPMKLAQIPKALKMLKTGVCVSGDGSDTSRVMAQSRTMSLAEALTNVIVGYALAVVVQIVVLPFFDVHLSWSDNLLIGIIFTIASIARSYFLRRVFEELQLRHRKRTRLGASDRPTAKH